VGERHVRGDIGTRQTGRRILIHYVSMIHIDIDERLILKWIFKSVRVQNGFVWDRIDSNDGFL
jgi:hypothetical protein